MDMDIDNHMSFPHQLVLVVQIDKFTFESMLINNWISNGVIPTIVGGFTMAKAFDFILMIRYICSFHG